MAINAVESDPSLRPLQEVFPRAGSGREAKGMKGEIPFENQKDPCLFRESCHQKFPWRRLKMLEQAVPASFVAVGPSACSPRLLSSPAGYRFCPSRKTKLLWLWFWPIPGLLQIRPVYSVFVFFPANISSCPIVLGCPGCSAGHPGP
jgi:hypothetical protein